jgi:F-type H+-transporting ATPase subunit epsilon
MMLHVSVISPEASLFDGDATFVVAPAFDGEVGILTNHAPMMTLLGKGELRVEGGAGARKFAIEGGFLQVVNNQVRVVTERGSAVQS